MNPFPLIAIASGKGGTGKTTVAVHLAAFLAGENRSVTLLDCDVEEPNAHLFLKPELTNAEPVGIAVPVIDKEKCITCGRCAKGCEFHALAMLPKPLLFPELCHGCHACTVACPTDAIHEEPRAIGVVESGQSGGIAFALGRLNVGEPMAPPLIRALKTRPRQEGLTLLDAPPGTSCSAVTAMQNADLVLLVTEPTPFGLHDLTLAVETVRAIGLPMGVVLNRADPDDSTVQEYCRCESIPLLAELPDDRAAAEAYARGNLFFETLPEWHKRFAALWNRMEALL